MLFIDSIITSKFFDESVKFVHMVGTNAIACSASNTGLWYSTDAGQTWTQSSIFSGMFKSVYMDTLGFIKLLYNKFCVKFK